MMKIPNILNDNILKSEQPRAECLEFEQWITNKIKKISEYCSMEIDRAETLSSRKKGIIDNRNAKVRRLKKIN